MTAETGDRGDSDAPHGAAVPLVVDLDHALSPTSLIDERRLQAIAGTPIDLLRGIGSGAPPVAAEDLPLREEVLALARAARDDGRPTVLVTAGDPAQAEVIARGTGLFDSVIAATSGPDRAATLTARYGAGGFDYVAATAGDLPACAAARHVITVGVAPALRQSLPAAEHISPPEPMAQPLIAAIRPHHWAKNLLIFLPSIAAHDMSSLPQVTLAVVAFSLTASAVYVINDLLDLAADRAHPRKRLRPFAAGRLSARTGFLLSAGLLALAMLAAALTASPGFSAVLLIYLVLTFAYSLALKRHLLVDVLTLAGLYTLRIIAGGVAATVNLSPWMLVFSIFLFLSLAAVKRQAELTDQIATGRATAGRAYQVTDLPILRGVSITAGQAAVLVFALYVSSNDVRVLYAFPGLLYLVCPLLLYWILRMVMVTHRSQMTDDPIVFATTDRMSVVAIGLGFLLGLIATIWPWQVPTI